MKEEIKEILDKPKILMLSYGNYISLDDYVKLKDYITNLQEEKNNYKHKFWEEQELNEYLQEENQNLKIQISAREEEYMKIQEENDNYKAQKYITDFISENGIICEKNKELERYKNIVNEVIEYIKRLEKDYDINVWVENKHWAYILMKLEKLKGE